MNRIVSCLACLAPLAVIGVFACDGDTVPLGGAGDVEDSGTADTGAITRSGSEAGTGSDTGTPSAPNDAAAKSGVFSFDALTSGTVPAGSKVIVIWSVVVSGPDYLYSFGGGSTTNGVFVSFSANPPAEALSDLSEGKLGIGVVGLVEASEAVGEGKITQAQFDNLQFVSANHFVIYRSSTEPIGASWPSKFPQGFACGRCVETDSTFDVLEPEDCKDFTLVPAAGADMCNLS